MIVCSKKSGAAVLLAPALAAGPALAKGTDSMKEMDTNADGKVSSAEHQTAASMKFDKADANKDGILTQGELTGFMMESKGKPEMKAAQKSESKVLEFDSNSDGSLSRQEFTDGSAAKFTRMDANSDGSLTMAEMKDGMESKSTY